jgi:hypothetical protein
MSESSLEYGLRQLSLMEVSLSEFEQGRVSLAALVKDLNALLATLGSASEQWKSAFKSEWWTLEQAHAIALDRGQSGLSDDSQRWVKEALANIRALIAELKSKLDSQRGE